MDLVGSTLGGAYRITRVIGRGGMGGVYEAVHAGNQQRYAVKVIAGELADDGVYLERFRREAQAAGQLGHPNIIQIYDYQRPANEPPFLVMELLEGRPLRLALKEGALGAPRAVALMTELLAALEVAHEAGIVHRDLKPDNVFLVPSPSGEHVKLLDFGIAKLMDGEVFTRLTQTGVLVGTPRYAAPEQLMGSRHVDVRTDVYAAGVLLYCMLTGRPPFMASGARLLLDITDKEPTDPHILVPTLNRTLVGVVRCAMAKDPNKRFPSARRFADALRPFARGGHDTLVSKSPLRAQTHVFSAPPVRAGEATPSFAAPSPIDESTRASTPQALGTTPAGVSTMPATPSAIAPERMPKTTRVSAPPAMPSNPAGAQTPLGSPSFGAAPQAAAPPRHSPLPRTMAMPAASLPGAHAPIAPAHSARPIDRSAPETRSHQHGRRSSIPSQPHPPRVRPEHHRERGGPTARFWMLAILCTILAGGIGALSVVAGMKYAGEQQTDGEVANVPAPETATRVELSVACLQWRQLACGPCSYVGRCRSTEATLLRIQGGEESLETCDTSLARINDECHQAPDMTGRRNTQPPPPIGSEICDRYARAACHCHLGSEQSAHCSRARGLMGGQTPSADLDAQCEQHMGLLPADCQE